MGLAVAFLLPMATWLDCHEAKVNSEFRKWWQIEAFREDDKKAMGEKWSSSSNCVGL